MVLLEKYQGYTIRLQRPLLNNVERIGRGISRFIPHYSIDRMDGVSALVLLYDEPLAFDSVSDILPLVDQVVVVDAGKHPASLPESDKIVSVRTPAEQDLQAKIGLLLSRYRWVLRWDGDFRCNEETKSYIDFIRSVKDGYWQIKCMVANVHKGNIDYLQKEHYGFTFHPNVLTANYTLLKKVSDRIALFRGGKKGRICYGTLPLFFGQIDTDMVFADHHYKHKSKQRLLERYYQAEWSILSDRDRTRYGSFDEYVRRMEEGVEQ